MRQPIRLLSLVSTLGLTALLLPGCGGGAGEGPTLVLSGITLVNSATTNTGAANVMTVVRFESLGPGGATPTYYPVIAPGGSQFIPLAPGNWFVTAIFTDGTAETGQAPVDPITIAPGANVTVTVRY